MGACLDGVVAFLVVVVAVVVVVVVVCLAPFEEGEGDVVLCSEGAGETYGALLKYKGGLEVKG